MLAVRQPVQNSLPQLPAEIWGPIARAALRAEGDDVHAWARLCLVSRAWHSALTGAYSNESQCSTVLVNTWDETNQLHLQSTRLMRNWQRGGVCRLQLADRTCTHNTGMAGVRVAGVPLTVTFGGPMTSGQIDGWRPHGCRCGVCSLTSMMLRPASCCSSRCECQSACGYVRQNKR